MPILACGINHKTAPITVRERVSFTSEILPTALADLLKLDAVNEAMILSTCNRTEIYSDAQDKAVLTSWFANQHSLQLDNISPHLYYYHDRAAVQHIMRVATGLDSMILGEPQILGQMKNAYAIAHKSGSIGGQFDRLFQSVFSVTKQIRTDTAIGVSPVSVAYAAVSLAKHIFANLSKRTALLIGAGETIELAAMHLSHHGVKQMMVANRSINKAQRTMQRLQSRVIRMIDIPVYLKDADIVISATSSQLPILGKGAVESAIKARKHRPIFMIDLAVPRDIEPEVGQLEDVYLYNVDDLRDIIDENLKRRETAAKQAEATIELQAEHYIRELQSLNAVETIRAYREKIENLSDKELLQALHQLEKGTAPEAVITALARNLTNKIMHTPTTQLRQAAYHGQLDFLLIARQLLGLD